MKGAFPTTPMDRQYQAEDDVRTLQRAHEIRADKPRHGRARAHAKKQASSLSRIAGPRKGRR